MSRQPDGPLTQDELRQFAMRIREIRSDSGLDAEAFGARTGMTEEKIMKIEAGSSLVQLPMMFAICRLTGADIGWLLMGPSVAPKHLPTGMTLDTLMQQLTAEWDAALRRLRTPVALSTRLRTLRRLKDLVRQTGQIPHTDIAQFVLDHELAAPDPGHRVV